MIKQKLPPTKYKLAAQLRRSDSGWKCNILGPVLEIRIRKKFMNEDFAIHCERGVVNVIPSAGNRPVEAKKPALTDYQYFLYLRAFNGIRIYKREKIEKMGAWEQELINKVNKKCHDVIADFLERALIVTSNRILKCLGLSKGRLFRQREEPIEIWDDPEEFKQKLGFRELYVTKKMIINELISKEVLPQNFYELTEDKRNWEQLINEPIDL